MKFFQKYDIISLLNHNKMKDDKSKILMGKGDRVISFHLWLIIYMQ